MHPVLMRISHFTHGTCQTQTASWIDLWRQHFSHIECLARRTRPSSWGFKRIRKDYLWFATLTRATYGTNEASGRGISHRGPILHLKEFSPDWTLSVPIQSPPENHASKSIESDARNHWWKPVRSTQSWRRYDILLSWTLSIHWHSPWQPAVSENVMIRKDCWQNCLNRKSYLDLSIWNDSFFAIRGSIFRELTL
jgi:hypothetical protein